MKFLTSHSVESRLDSLSIRIASIAHGNTAYISYVDQKITGQNLKYNLSLIISKIILSLQYADRSKNTFIGIIEKYNQTNKANLTYGDFEKSHLIRSCMGDIVFPSVVRYFLWNLDDEKSNEKDIEIPKQYSDLIPCLKLYYNEYFKDKTLTIDARKVKGIVEGNSYGKLTVDYFVENGLLSIKDANTFSWRGNEPARHLRNEIASTLWLWLRENDLQYEDKYFKLLIMTGIWPDQLERFLTPMDGKDLRDLAVMKLENENDFEKTESEFNKIWMDSPGYRHREIGQKIPTVRFNYDSIYDFVESSETLGRFHHEISDYQKARSYANLLLNIIVQFDKNPVTYNHILRILRNMEKPALIWATYKEIQRTYPKLIPYLLTYQDLAALAFSLIDEIKLDTDLLENTQNRDDATKASWNTKNYLWLEMFDMILEHYSGLHTIDHKQAEVAARVLIECTNKLFNNNVPDTNGGIIHSMYHVRYEKALEKLSAKRMTSFRTYPQPLVIPRIMLYLIPEIAGFCVAELGETTQIQGQFLHFKAGTFDLCVELVKLLNSRVSEIEIKEEQIAIVTESSQHLIKALNTHLTWFYTTKEIEHQNFESAGKVKIIAHRRNNEFAFEIIDWGYLYLQFEKEGMLDLLKENFETELALNAEKEYYEDENREEKVKIRHFLTALTIAYLAVNRKKSQFELEALPVSEVLRKLKEWITVYFLRFCTNDVPNGRIDILDDTFTFFKNNKYQHDLHVLLHQSLNYFDAKEREDFIRELYDNSIELEKMLSAMNIIESNHTRTIISELINNINMDDFLNTRRTVTEYENALIEAINSETHWDLAQPLIEKVKAHFENKQYHQAETERFIFRINLLLAFKEKDFAKLCGLEIPKKQYAVYPVDKELVREKKFYQALFKLYNDREYSDAATLFRGLLSEDPKNLTYAYYLYHAETLKSIKLMNIASLNKAHKEWEDFLKGLSEEEKSKLQKINEQVLSTNIYHFAVNKDAARFDQTLNILSNPYKFNQELIPIIYNYYLERELHEMTFSYSVAAKDYLIENGEDIKPEVEKIIGEATHDKTLLSIKQSLINLKSLTPHDIAKVTPDNVNNKRNLSEFVLHELIEAGKIMLEKIEGIRHIPHENRYNDLLIATLRLRFQIWGWSCHDQGRSGRSASGKDAGETDVMFQSNGSNITVCEAFILTGRDKGLTEKHINKCFTYNIYLDDYYIIVYYKGPQVNFDSTWESYKDDIINCPYDTRWQIDKTRGLEDFSKKFFNVTAFRIAKSFHNTQKSVYHLMIDLSDYVS